MLPSYSTTARKRTLSDGADVHGDGRKKPRNMGLDKSNDPSGMPIPIDNRSDMADHQSDVPIVYNHPYSVLLPNPSASVPPTVQNFISNSIINEIHGDYINIHTTTFSNIRTYREWLAPCDPSTNHHSATEKHHAGTGTWLLENKMYMNWKKDPNSIMWIHGISGAGKTVVFSTVVKDIQCIVQKGSTTLAYFYCDISDAKKRTLTEILRALVTSLLAQQPSDLSILERAYEDCMDGLSKPSNDKLWEVLKQFCWVACQLDELKKCTKRKTTLKYILDHLPDTLEAMYDQILNRISTADALDAAKLLLWLTFAEHPIHIDYLADVVEFDMDDKTFNSSASLSSPEDILVICSSLVTRMDDNTVQLAHASVKQYIMQKFFVLGSFAFNNWVRVNNYQRSMIENMDSSSLLQCAAFHGLSGMVEWFLPTVVNESEVIKAVSAASQCGHTATVRVLLGQCMQGQYGNSLEKASKHGADVNAQGGRYGNALQAALLGGHEQVVELLLEKGADVNAQRGFYGNALQAASYQNHKQVVELLFEKGADVNAQRGFYENALQAASSEGHKQVVELLLGSGADVNAQGGFYGNALQAASSEGHKQVVELLLEKGADVNAQGGEYGNALQAALLGGHEQVVELLLEKGADVNAQGGEYGNALQAASCHNDKQVVELLLEKGADVNAQGGFYGNALQAVSYYYHKEPVIELLLEKGADVNAQGGFYGNALQAASSEGHKQVVELLLERGADVNAQRGFYGNALQAASYQNHKQVVELLLEKGADANAQGGEYGSALQAALLGGHEQVVELLLERGANVDAL
ncbi:vegetative incompatibility protein HET-E-1 [Amanita rubescens]|nr:vegetative incompatibility protein HET-E-1 [Amanita rubescens]